MSQGILRDLERERKALHAVLTSSAFPPSSNPARLLSFLCEKYFESPNTELTEYDVAVGALGRRSDFDPRRDSVVRVEVHRLRKRLKDFYRAGGASLPMQIVLPPGRYAPQFIDIPQGEARVDSPPQAVAVGSRSRIWMSVFAVALLAALVWLGRSQKRNPTPAAPAAAAPGLGLQSDRKSVV